MSPLSLRRYRAERLLRQQFQALHTGVIAAVARRLHARGVRLDGVDLEACYAQAWHALYAAVLEGREIANPPGWLALVTYRRALDEHRARRRMEAGPAGTTSGARRAPAEHEPAGRGGGLTEPDLAAELDDRARLRQLFEGLRLSLGARELQAATLCYLHGLSRAEAAARMGLSEARMRKLMEGRGPGREGVASKVAALVATIRDGDWCEEQASLMRGLALGVLDPDGERYRLAQAHRYECPSCRAYVRSLRGLAAVLPPVPALLRWVLGGARGSALAGPAGTHGGVGVHGGLGIVARSGTGGAVAVPGAAATGGAGAGAAGGGWLVAGAATKLALGCLLAAGLSAGCVALTLAPVGPGHASRQGRVAHHAGAGAVARPVAFWRARASSAATSAGGVAHGVSAGVSRPLPSSMQASHEFGPERLASGAAAAGTAAAVDHVVPARRTRAVAARASSSQPPPGAVPAEPSSGGAPGGARAGDAAAQREFGVG